MLAEVLEEELVDVGLWGLVEGCFDYISTRLMVGPRSLKSGMVEVQSRRGRVQEQELPLGGEKGALLDAVDSLWESLP